MLAELAFGTLGTVLVSTVRCLMASPTVLCCRQCIHTCRRPSPQYRRYLVYRLMLMTADIFYNDLAFMYKLKLFKVHTSARARMR